MIIGCYTLDLYCKDPRAKEPGDNTCTAYPGQFTGQTERECIRAARRRGFLDRVVANCEARRQTPGGSR